MTADDEGMGKSNASTSTSQAAQAQTANPTSTQACLNKMSNISFMAPLNENSSSSGCGGTVSSLSVAALMSASAADGNADAVMKSSFERLEVTSGAAHFARPNNLDQEYSAMVASVYENEIAKWVSGMDWELELEVGCWIEPCQKRAKANWQLDTLRKCQTEPTSWQNVKLSIDASLQVSESASLGSMPGIVQQCLT